MNFDQAPLLVIWEVTQACDLACVHCRASAQSEPASAGTDHRAGVPAARRDPLLRRTADGVHRRRPAEAAGPLRPDPLQRQDRAAHQRDAERHAAADAGGHRGFKEAGVTPHGDQPGRARRRRRTTISAAFRAPSTGPWWRCTTRRRSGSTRSSRPPSRAATWTRLPEIAEIAGDVGTKMWSLFFLIVTGRAAMGDDLLAEEYEKVFEFMYELSKTAPFGIKTTEAMHYRRYVAQRMKAEHGGGGRRAEGARQVAFRTAGVSDGKGFVFVSHTGEIFPSGFLPISGRQRAAGFAHGRLPQLADCSKDCATPAREGKCGICEYQKICGGSRSRAYALTGDYLAEDPRCVYQPHLADAHLLKYPANFRRARGTNVRYPMRAAVFLLACGLLAQTPDPAYEPLAKAYEALRNRDYDEAIALFPEGNGGRAGARRHPQGPRLHVPQNRRERSRARPVPRSHAAGAGGLPRSARIRLPVQRNEGAGAGAAHLRPRAAGRRPAVARHRRAGLPEYRRTARSRASRGGRGHPAGRGELQRALRVGHAGRAARRTGTGGRALRKGVAADPGPPRRAGGPGAGVARAEPRGPGECGAAGGFAGRRAARGRSRRGNCCRRAIRSCRSSAQALALDPANIELRRELAYLLLRMERQAEAEEEFRHHHAGATRRICFRPRSSGFLYLGARRPAERHAAARARAARERRGTRQPRARRAADAADAAQARRRSRRWRRPWMPRRWPSGASAPGT